MSSNSDFRKEPESEPPHVEDEDNEWPRKRPRCGSLTSPLNIITDSIPMLGVSELDSAMDATEMGELIITRIQATDVALGLRRLPAGFYTAVYHSGFEWRTENKPSSVNGDVVEWIGVIPIPSDPSSTVHLEVYAPFEFQPMLGPGEQLRKLTVTVEQLLDRSKRSIPFAFFPKAGDVVSPCSSISVTVERQQHRRSDSSASRVSVPHTAAESHGELEDATNQGHNALSRYRRHGERRDLEHSIDRFQQALRACPPGHPCRAAAQSNLATAKLVLCQVEDTDALLPLSLYRGALRARPVGHVDRPSTLVQLAVVHLAQFKRLRDKAEGARAEALLQEAISLSHGESHEYRAATLLLQLHAEHSADPLRRDERSIVEQDSTSRLMCDDLGVLSVQLLERFERFGDLADLEQAITVLKQLTKSISIRDHQYHAILGSLSSALSRRFQCLGELSDLENAISMLRTATDLTPDTHPHKLISLVNLGTFFTIRFQRLGELNNLEDAISSYRSAIDLAPDGDPQKFIVLNNLGSSLAIRFQRLAELGDLEEAISTLKAALDITPDSHPYKSKCLTNLGNSFRNRFERLRELSDMENAISFSKAAIDLTPRGHPEKAARLSNLGNCFRTRFGHLGELSDLEDGISALKASVDLTPDGHPDKHACLGNLGGSFLSRFRRLQELRDLEDAISTHKAATNLTPHDHPALPGHLTSLGDCFRIRFEHLGELNDLEDAISALKTAVDLTPDGHPDQPSYLRSLGHSLTARFERLGGSDDIRNAISVLRTAVDLTPDGHPDKTGRLGSLASSFTARYEKLRELNDLEDAITALKTAADLTPDGHPDKPGCLSSLATSLTTRYKRLGELNDLEDAISALKTVTDLTPDDHPHKSSHLSSLASSFMTRYEELGELSDLEHAIATCKTVVQVTPNGHPNKPSYLTNLGNAFGSRFRRLGGLGDLEDAISNHRAVVNLTPDGHPGKPSYFSNLGNTLVARFERLGELSDLEEATLIIKTAVDLTPRDQPNKFVYLNNLGNALRVRYMHLRELSDLENAILSLKAAIDLAPHGHPNMVTSLHNLGTCLRARFEHLGQLSDLEGAISNLKAVVGLIPRSHPEMPTSLNNLGNAYFTGFMHLGRPSDLGNAISAQRAAVDLTPHGHYGEAICLSNLGNSFFIRFKHSGAPNDLEDAIATHKAANDLIPLGHLMKPAHLLHLGRSFIARFERLKELGDLEVAISLYFHAASSSVGPTTVRFSAAKEWISCARRVDHSSLLYAYSVAIDLLPQLAWVGLSFSQRYSQLVQGANLVREAAAAALGMGFPETAVEWLEQGRSIVWGELFQLRSPYEELSSAYPEYAEKLRDLSTKLEHASTTREQTSPTFPSWTGDAIASALGTLEQEADEHRAVAIKRDKLLQEIRRLPGFERFLLQKEFSRLRASARAGPVVLLNAAESRCDALVVLANVNHVIHVPLPDFSSEQSVGLQNTLKSLVRHARVGYRDVPSDLNWECFLAPLWKSIVKPVLDALAFSIPGDLSRIFWCPTGPIAFLPIHAAGFYDTDYSQPGHKVFDYVVSSYIPTLSVLAQSHDPVEVPNDDLRLLFVRQPNSDGHSRLPGVFTELEKIKSVIGSLPSPCTTLVESSLGTVEEVLSLMKQTDWAHFACHGVQDHVDSGLCLADQRRLKLRDIVALSRPHGGLAFLSACQTAKGEELLADEAIHLAAGMLFAGYGGVIGTMWSISDSLAPIVAREVYGELIRNGTRPDYRGAARALHDAMAYVRERGNASFEEWLPFIHVGL